MSKLSSRNVCLVMSAVVAAFYGALLGVLLTLLVLGDPSINSLKEGVIVIWNIAGKTEQYLIVGFVLALPLPLIVLSRLWVTAVGKMVFATLILAGSFLDMWIITEHVKLHDVLEGLVNVGSFGLILHACLVIISWSYFFPSSRKNAAHEVLS